MKIIIFADADGCARSIRGNCIQPVMGGGGIWILTVRRAIQSTRR